MMENNLPNHVGIILDGNRRWAKERHLPTLLGHQAGLKQTIKLVEHLENKGVKIVTIYAFSTENWKRSQKEVSYLMRLFGYFMRRNIIRFKKIGGRINILGNMDPLPNFLKKQLIEAIETTKNNSHFILQVALNYGSRDEIVRAVRKMITDNVSSEKVSEKLISTYLDTEDVADPDLIIRTSGEQRLSNFMLWQSAYSELYFSPDYLPDFTEEKLDLVLDWFVQRQRRLGK